MASKPASLEAKLRHLVFVAAAMTAALLFAAEIVEKTIHRGTDFQNRLDSLLLLASTHSAQAMASSNLKGIQEDFSSVLKAFPDVYSATLNQSDGSVIARYVKTGAEEPASWQLLNLSRPVASSTGPIGRLDLQVDLTIYYWHLAVTILQTLALVSLAVFISLRVANRMGRQISVPVTELAKTMNALAENRDYSLRASKLSGDEVGRLADHFNEMLGRIQVHDEDLRRHRESLEDQVAKRTHELSVANLRLEQELERRARSEARLANSLKEKEVMLREIHHRVKNNMQVVASLLQLQQRNVNDPVTLQALKESQARIRSMAMIHEKLYRTEDMALVDFAGYSRELADEILAAHAAGDRVSLVMESGNVQLDIEKAIPAGLILNELISNVLKHGLPEPRHGQLSIIVRATDPENVELRVKDDGAGMPEDFNWRNAQTLGLRLVQMLSRQLNGQVTQRSRDGTEFQVIFPA